MIRDKQLDAIIGEARDKEIKKAKRRFMRNVPKMDLPTEDTDKLIDDLWQNMEADIRARQEQPKEQEDNRFVQQSVEQPVEKPKAVEKPIEKPKEAEQPRKKWDFGKNDPITYFDATKSYEITGYRPITETRGKSFNPDWFTETREVYNRTGHYTEYPFGSKAFRDFWTEQYRRCKYGLTVNGYTITGDHYFFLNFYRLKDLVNVTEAGGGRQDIFPIFLEGQYEWFHYLKLAKVLRVNALMLKARSAGYSEIEASIIANSYNCIKGSINVACAFAANQLDKLLEKVWACLSFLNEHTDGGFFKSRQAYDSQYLKRASQYKMMNGQKVEIGWMSQIQGIVTDSPSKLRGDRTDLLVFEECGMFKNLTKAYTQADALVGQIGKQHGIRLLGGQLTTKLYQIVS